MAENVSFLFCVIFGVMLTYFGPGESIYALLVSIELRIASNLFCNLIYQNSEIELLLQAPLQLLAYSKLGKM